MGGGGNSLCAIQVKFYAEAHTISKSDINSFLEGMSRSHFQSGILVHTAKKISGKVESALKGHNCNILGAGHLTQSRISWPDIKAGLVAVKKRKPFQLRPHQKTALRKVSDGFSKSDRGKMIMACGTGKTFTSLRIAEKIVGKGGLILYLVPSISLMRQSIREWSEQQTIQQKYIGVCSDTRVGTNDEDTSLVEMEIPVTTNEKEISKALRTRRKDCMTVLFSTYQSIKQVEKALKKLPNVKIDLVLCDEAHRTTGVEDSDVSLKDTSHFVIVHDNKRIPAMRRLYMTATQRIYSDSTKSRARSKGVTLYSMDDPKKYGDLFHEIKFSEAISKDLLSDYRVVVLSIDERYAAKTLQAMLKNLTDDGSEIRLDDATKMLGCWKALENPGGKAKRLQKAIAFTNRISDSKNFTNILPKLIEAVENKETDFTCAVKHVDGAQNALDRANHILWLEGSTRDESVCHIVSNARCLTEGVDVPALDAILFLNPKSSMVDIVQAVGRVMRKSPEKEYGYIILPIAIPAGSNAEDALDDNRRYQVVWDVLSALRSHDDRLDIEINQTDLNKRLPKNVSWIGTDRDGNTTSTPDLKLPIAGELVPAGLIYAKLVDRVGDRRYFEDWAKDVADITSRIKIRISLLVENNKNTHKKFNALRDGLQAIINDSITDDDTLDILSQHLVTRRIFNSLFGGTQFTSHNAVAKALDGVIDTLDKQGLGAETQSLEEFYRSVERRVSGISDHEGRQKIIKDLYGRFFEIAFPKLADRLGIIYTPIEVVDFILKSVDHISTQNFGKGIGDRGVSVIDAFVGTGSFITRMMSRDLELIKDADLEYKFSNELHACEIVLLAYYIAAINCESTYHERTRTYKAFDGLVLTDTFHEKKIDEQWNKNLMSETMKRIEDQRKKEIRVIVGNPPWSAGQRNYNDDNQNLKYPEIDQKIKETFVKRTKSGAKTTLYDLYIRSIRWASDRIQGSGVIGFVTNSSFLRSNTAEGIRAVLAEEFNEIWCFDLRGNGRITGDGRSVFEYPGQSSGGTRTPVAITILVKNTEKTNSIIRYTSLEDKYYSGEDKRKRIKELNSINEIKNWQIIKPDVHHDWLNQRRNDFSKYLPIGSKSVKSGLNNHAIFKTYSAGIKTNRDTWAYNSSVSVLIKNIKQHINYCNEQDLNNIIHDPTHAKWTQDLTDKLRKKTLKFNKICMRRSLYRPFFKQYLYFDDILNNSVYRIPSLFPKNQSKNLIICVPDKGKTGMFSVVITALIPDVHIIEQSQCFPLYTYENNNKKKINITNYVLTEYQNHYQDKKIAKTSIFYYVYGLLHHPQYRKKFTANLSKELPHIPMAPNFWTFSKTGKKLADIHLNFETCKRYRLGTPKYKFKKFSKLSFARKSIQVDGKTKNVIDKTVLRVDGTVTFDNIPDTKYQVNGRTPIEWIVDRYKITIDKDSGITNDPCTGTDIIAVIERAIYVGLESDKLVKTLPKEFEPKNWQPPKKGINKFI